jgi:hypothetical protein
MPGTLDIPNRSSVPPSPFLKAKCAALRRKHVRTTALTGLATAVGVGAELLALAMFVDWCLDLPWPVRLLLLLSQAGLFACLFLRFVAGPILHPLDDDDLALMVEKARPTFRSRLIAATQLTRPGGLPEGISTGFVQALVEETEAMAAPMDFNTIVSTEKLRRLGALAITVAALGIVAFIAGGTASAGLLKRVFLSTAPVPRKTRVRVIEGNKLIGRGDSVRLEAWASGIIPSFGKLEIRYPGRRTEEFGLEQDRHNRKRFGRTIENVQESFTYTFFLNDGQSQPFEVTAIARPTVAAIECDQFFPAYTGLKPAHRSLGDLALLAGSRLNLKVMATKPLRAAALKLVGAPNPLPVPILGGFPPLPLLRPTPQDIVPLRLGGSQNTELTGGLIVPPKGLAGFTVLMLDADGMESRDSAIYRIDCIPDKAPIIHITYPERKEELITRQATLPLAFEALDDFQITSLRLRYKVDNAADDAVKTVEMDLEGQKPQRLKRRHDWQIGAFSPLLAEGTSIEYWIEAEDNNHATGPGLGMSEHQFVKVVSESEKRADLLNRAGDYLGSIGDLAGDQEKLNQKLGTLIRGKSARE